MNSLASLYAHYPFVFFLSILLLGLIVGSFLNVVIHRLPVILERGWRKQCEEMDGKTSTVATERYNLAYPGSQCPACGHRITALENIPLLSYAWLRGRCRACGKKISWRYPFVELVTGLLSIVMAWHFGFSIATVGALIFVWALIALTFIDYDTQLLPDNITLPLLWLGLVFNIGGVYVSLTSAVIGAMAGYLSLWLVYQGFKLITGREGMGYGDFKLFAAFGAWLGWQQLPLTILLSSFVGAIVGLGGILIFGRDRAVPIPFGPFLCLAAIVAMLWGDDITRAYLQFARF